MENIMMTADSEIKEMLVNELNSFPCLYPNDKYFGKSLDESIDLKNCDGHVMRDSSTGKFLYFENIMKLTNYFMTQTKPYLHSVVNKFKPLRFNLELDMPTTLLDNIIFPKATIAKIEQDGLDINLIKSLKALENVQESIYDIFEDIGIEMSEYKFLTASDNRKDKYSYRMYLKLAFVSMREYKYFMTLLKDRVRPEILPMIDPTSLMLRTPGSYKDNHCCKWMSPCSIDEAILSYTDNCDMLEPRAPEEEIETEFDELTADVTKSAVALIATHPIIQGNYYYSGENKGFLILKRIQPSYCTICKRIHDVSDAYVTVYRDNVHLRCYRDDTKGSVFLGFVGEAEPMKFRWADVKALMKTQDRLKENGMSTKEKSMMVTEQKRVFDEVKKEALVNDGVVDKIQKFVYTDFIKFHNKTFTDDKNVLRYIQQTIAKIVMGGNSLFITSDEWKGSKHFTELNMLPCSKTTETYSYDIINPMFDTEQPIDPKKNPLTIKTMLCDTINKFTMMEFYKAVDFVPYLVKPKETNREIFNMFEGFKYPYVAGQTEIKPSVLPWILHILNIICCGDAELAKIMTQWLAHIVQVPAEKAFAVILYGKQGTGKSILYEFFTRCIGKDLGIQVSKLDDLTQSHNTHVRGKLILNANEATNEPCIRDVNILKGLITETDLIINPKNVNQYTVSNYSRLMITSNYEQCMRLDKDDRRYMCLQISDKKKNNDEYFAPLIESLTNEETQADFFNYLANYDISDFKHQRPPMTNMKRNMIGMSVNNVVSYVLDVCENTVFGFDYEEEMDEIVPTSKDLFDSYITWCSQNDAKGRKFKKVGFIKEMKDLFGLVECRPHVDGSRLRRFKINRTELLPKFKEHYCRDEFNYKIA